MTKPLVEMKNIYKKFGHVEALRGVTIAVRYQEVLGLLGDNGAGKSTLVKVLVGIYPLDRGEIFFEGEKTQFSSPKEARAKGIETVYQGGALIELMTIPRNFCLGREFKKDLIVPGVFLDKMKMNRVSMKALKEIGISIKPSKATVSVLSGGERQSVCIGRAMHYGSKLIILDEPTASLGVKETEVVLNFIKKAKERGFSIIFITHNVYHVYQVADRFVVLEKGVKIGDFYKADTSPEQLVNVMTGGIKT